MSKRPKRPCNPHHPGSPPAAYICSLLDLIAALPTCSTRCSILRWVWQRLAWQNEVGWGLPGDTHWLGCRQTNAVQRQCCRDDAAPRHRPARLHDHGSKVLWWVIPVCFPQPVTTHQPDCLTSCNALQDHGSKVLWWVISVCDPQAWTPGRPEAEGRGRPWSWPKFRNVVVRCVWGVWKVWRVRRGPSGTLATGKAVQRHHCPRKGSTCVRPWCPPAPGRSSLPLLPPRLASQTTAPPHPHPPPHPTPPHTPPHTTTHTSAE